MWNYQENKEEMILLEGVWSMHIWRQTPRAGGPGPHIHFRAVSHVTGILGIFQFVLPFLPLRAQFSSELPEILHEVS